MRGISIANLVNVKVFNISAFLTDDMLWKMLRVCLIRPKGRRRWSRLEGALWSWHTNSDKKYDYITKKHSICWILNMIVFLTSLKINAPLGILICHVPYGNLKMSGPLDSLNMNDPFGGLNSMALSQIWMWSALF